MPTPDVARAIDDGAFTNYQKLVIAATASMIWALLAGGRRISS